MRCKPDSLPADIQQQRGLNNIATAVVGNVQGMRQREWAPRTRQLVPAEV